MWGSNCYSQDLWTTDKKLFACLRFKSLKRTTEGKNQWHSPFITNSLNPKLLSNVWPASQTSTRVFRLIKHVLKSLIAMTQAINNAEVEWNWILKIAGKPDEINKPSRKLFVTRTHRLNFLLYQKLVENEEIRNCCENACTYKIVEL